MVCIHHSAAWCIGASQLQPEQSTADPCICITSFITMCLYDWVCTGKGTGCMQSSGFTKFCWLWESQLCCLSAVCWNHHIANCHSVHAVCPLHVQEAHNPDTATLQGQVWWPARARDAGGPLDSSSACQSCFDSLWHTQISLQSATAQCSRHKSRTVHWVQTVCWGLSRVYMHKLYWNQSN